MSKPVTTTEEFTAAKPAKPLTGKVALVTGGSRGIGAAIAKELADQGADVALSYAASADKAEDVAKELKSKGVRAAAFKADQADAKQVDDLVRKVAKEFGRLDILVDLGCRSTFRLRVSIQWRETFCIGLSGVGARTLP